MTALRDSLLESHKDGTFLKAVYAACLADEDARSNLNAELKTLHNEGLIDVVDAFALLKKGTTNGPDFFMTRHVFEKILPELTASISPVMRCSLLLCSEAGDDMAAGTILNSYADFCAKQTERSREALKEIELHPDEFASLLTATVSAGSRLDHPYFLAEAIRLTQHSNIALRRSAVFAIGRLAWPKGGAVPIFVVEAIERSASTEEDDHILAGLIKTAFVLLQQDASQEARLIALIKKVLSKGDAFTLHAASELFGFNTCDLSTSLLELLLKSLQRVKPTNNGTLNNIDFGISHLLENSDPQKALQFLEDMLLAHADTLTLEIFDSALSQIRGNKTLVSKVLTRWFLRGDRVLCNGVQTIVGAHHGNELRLAVDPNELPTIDLVHVVFVARKAIGYLFFQPTSAAAVLISLMEQTSDDEILTAIRELLFDPLLLNFPGKAREYVANQTKLATGKVKDTLESLLQSVDDYLNALHAVDTLPALHPSQAQREAYHRYLSSKMAESYKAAEAQSVFYKLFSKSVLLYGRKSIDYVHGPDGKSHRTQMPLQKHGVEMEFPRMESIDAFGLDYMLRVFKAERFRT